MAQIIEKRTADSATFDIVCAGILASGEVITSIVSVADDGGVLTFGVPITNPSPITLSNGVIYPAGTIVQVLISGGAIPAGSDSLKRGVPNLLCTIRAKVTTNQSPLLDATVLLLLQDQPV